MQPIPTSGPILNWLRNEASQPFVQGREGAEDDLPLGWLPQLASSDQRVPDAVVQLLGERDPVVTSRIVAVAAASDAPALKGAVARAIGKSASVLASVHAGSEQSALGTAVYAIWPPPPLSDDTIQALTKISRREDGWPLSLRIAIAVDFSRVADSVVSAFEQMTDDDQGYVLLGLLQRAAPNTIVALLQRIGNDGSAALRARVSAALKTTLDKLDEARAFAAKSGVDLPGEPGSARWQKLGPLLRTP